MLRAVLRDGDRGDVLLTVEASRNMEARAWADYRAELLRFVAARVRDPDAAEDIVHDVFVKAYRHRDDLENRVNLRAWLYRITRNTIVDYYRSQRRTEELPDNLTLDDPAADGDAERQLARCLRPLMDELPPHYRDTLTLADLDGLSQREVAAREGLSVSGVKSRVKRGRRMLRDVLLQCCRVEFDRRGGVIDYERAQPCDDCEH